MFDFQFFTAQEVDDNRNKPYLITIHMVNGQEFTLGRDTEKEASDTINEICDFLIDGRALLYAGYVVIKLSSVVSITLTRQN